MNAENRPPIPEYRCPGDPHPISRAVHLGRLAAFYPACRTCPHRNDTATLSPRQVEQLQEVQSSVTVRSVFHDEGAGGVYLNDFTPQMARGIAAAFGEQVRTETKGKGDQRIGSPCLNQQSEIRNQQSEIRSTVLLASDGRAITGELTAAVGEGLRSIGCDVIDIGPATSACLAFAIRHLQASGGLLVGNPGQEPHFVGLQFWDADPSPLSTGGSLEPIITRYHTEIACPARRQGALQRFQADADYLAEIEQHYHAMRPLRIVVDSASMPLVQYLERLAAGVACQVIPSRVSRRELSQLVRAEKAHFAASINGDGETCNILDEQGGAVAAERLLQLLARNTSQTTIERLEQLGGTPVVLGGIRRAEMAAAMQTSGAILGGGPGGRFWHLVAGIPLPDALMTVTRLLERLSQSDEPLSRVLDRDAPTR